MLRPQSGEGIGRPPFDSHPEQLAALQVMEAQFVPPLDHEAMS